jgi:hypothetical protein
MATGCEETLNERIPQARGTQPAIAPQIDVSSTLPL